MSKVIKMFSVAELFPELNTSVDDVLMGIYYKEVVVEENYNATIGLYGESGMMDMVVRQLDTNTIVGSVAGNLNLQGCFVVSKPEKIPGMLDVYEVSIYPHVPDIKDIKEVESRGVEYV